jgi:threonine aldolase
MDGARIFNAALATNTTVRDLTGFCDAVDVCLCKGLAAPLGSMLMGSRDFIDEARRVRQRIGGGMRQAGVIAAPGILALTKMVERLPEDHENAETMRRGLEAKGIAVDRAGVLTNIVNLDVSPAGWTAPLFAERLLRHGIKAKVCTEHTLRMVLHNDIGAREVSVVLDRVGEVLRARA